MEPTPDPQALGFMVLSDADFERLTLTERVEYMKSAVAALQRLQKQIQRTMEEFRAK